MRKLTRKSLDELAQRMPVLSENAQSSFIGGGDGTSMMNPYTFEQYKAMGTTFVKGWVDLPDSISFLRIDYDSYMATYGGASGYWGGSGYDGTSGYWGGSGYDGSSGYWSGDGDGNSSDKNQIIQELKNQLPTDLVASYSVNVRYSSTITSPGQYDPNTNTIYLRDLTYDALFAEYVHLVQKKDNLCGTNHAAKEFQEHIIGDLMSTYRFCIREEGMGWCLRTVFDNDYSSNYETWIKSCIDNRGVNMTTFLNGINNYVQHFFKSKSNVPQYQGEIPSNYNFDWEKMINKMGIPCHY